MNSAIALVFPFTSFLFLLQNVFKKQISIFSRVSISLPALVMFIIDLFVYLIFYFNCNEARVFFRELNCIGVIYPTVDFLVFSIVSLFMMVAAIIGINKKWERRNYFISGTIVIYTGFCARLFVLITSAQAISQASGSFNPVVLEIFSIVVVYGLITSVFYLIISLLGMFTK
jgi:hypothetical protein